MNQVKEKKKVEREKREFGKIKASNFTCCLNAFTNCSESCSNFIIHSSSGVLNNRDGTSNGGELFLIFVRRRIKGPFG